ncbi:hypothetical protein OIU84_012080 [Salix udensis]|uniref:Uncharacterized protein n=1 Tax=Salix udensis TaxID=889485 RepID=A0AAD6JER0_9ROSI|nr:hypothetical protein OIU84_012080 [Salix udensis]
MEAAAEAAGAAAGRSRKCSTANGGKKEKDLFHVIHKVPAGDGPYVKAKHAQLVQKDPEAAITELKKPLKLSSLFEAVARKQAQESLDNVLIDLYKKCGKVEEQIEMIKRKLRSIYQGEAFNGKPTKTARSHGKKFQVSVKQETSRLLGNLGWAYMQKTNFIAAEVVYKKAQMVDPDANKACNLAICLIKQARYNEAHSTLLDVTQGRVPGSGDAKARSRAEKLLMEVSSRDGPDELMDLMGFNLDDDFVKGLEKLMDEWGPSRSKRLPIFEEISSF